MWIFRRREGEGEQPLCGTMVRNRASKDGEDDGTVNLETVPIRPKNARHMTKKLGKQRSKLTPRAFESREFACDFQLRTWKNRILQHFLHARRVLDVSLPGFCQCGWRHQDVLNTSLSSVRPQLSGVRSYTKWLSRA